MALPPRRRSSFIPRTPSPPSPVSFDDDRSNDVHQLSPPLLRQRIQWRLREDNEQATAANAGKRPLGDVQDEVLLFDQTSLHFPTLFDGREGDDSDSESSIGYVPQLKLHRRCELQSPMRRCRQQQQHQRRSNNGPIPVLDLSQHTSDLIARRNVSFGEGHTPAKRRRL